MTVPVMLAATSVAVVGLPILATVAIVADLARGRRKLPTLRVYGFLLQYLVNDSLEIVLAPVYWVAAGFGTRLDSAASMARHQRLQTWSISTLVRRAQQLLGLRIELAERDRQALTPGPVIVISRHASLFDASLPGHLYQEVGFGVRGVIMAELLADPGFDLIYGRLGSVFIPRDDGPRARAEIAAMTERAPTDTAFIIFPEGRLFDPGARDRALARLADGDTERAKRLASLSAVLPPRPGGFQGLLAALPDADVVVLDHTGLDRFRTVADLIDAVPATEPIRVTAARHRRADIPDDPIGQVAWLDEVWLRLDQAR